MNNKNWFYLVITLSILGYFSYLGLIYCFYKDPLSIVWVQKIYEQKTALAKSIKGKKIVVIGGSNVVFSIRTADIESQFKIPSVNYGTFAGLGLDYILDKVCKENFLNKGDIVVLSIEPHLIAAEKKYYDLAATNYFLTCDREYFNSLPIKDKFIMLESVPPEKLYESIIQQIIFACNPAEIQKKNYNPKTLNRNGDETLHPGSYIEDKIKTGEITPLPSLKSHLTDTYYTRKLDNFISSCHKKGVIVFATYPSIPYFEEYKTPEYKILFIDLDKYYKKRNVITLGKPDNYIFDRKLFYDTFYHLNDKGMTIKTQMIIKELKKHI